MENEQKNEQNTGEETMIKNGNFSNFITILCTNHIRFTQLSLWQFIMIV